MHIIELTFRNRNDFHFIAVCRHCRRESRWTDGYADEYYQRMVFPHRHCPHCEIDEYGGASEERAASHPYFPQMMDTWQPKGQNP